MALSTTGIAPYAEAREAGSGWYVFWDAGLAYGACGWGLAREAAEHLAERIKRGETKP